MFLAMTTDCNNELWWMLLYCGILWFILSLAFWLADSQRRLKEASISGFVELFLISTLALISGYAAAALQQGMLMTTIFQLAGVLISSIAVSRVIQMLSWTRTWIAALLSMLGYLAAGIALLWLMAAAC